MRILNGVEAPIAGIRRLNRSSIVASPQVTSQVMLRIVVSMLLLLIASHAPLSSAATLEPGVLDAVPRLTVPAADIERARAALSSRNEKDPVRLTVGVPVSLSLADGLWTAEGGRAVWRARVYAAGAPQLIAAFDRFELPDGAQLRFSDVAGTVVLGPYTRANRAGDGTLVTAMVPGEEGLIEMRLPSEQRDAVKLHLGGLGYGIDDSTNGGVVAKSGSCNVDVACPAGNAWRSQIRSVVYLQIPSGSLGATVKCTGQLINNTAGNAARPFLLTANHCGANASNAGNITAYFNYQTATCNGIRTESPVGFPSQTGMTYRANHQRADHTLLEFNAIPASSLNVFYTGFNASTTATPDSGASIHHPAGHEKRISLYSEARRVSNQSVGLFTVDAFEIYWDSGVTEGGSSGSGLWNQNGLLVGVLSGGVSSCAAQNDPDYYGRLDLAWDNLGSFLDPSGTGTRTAAGREGNAPANRAPVAVDDAATTAEDTPLVLTSATLVSNDTDADNNTLTVSGVNNAVNGTVSLASGTITFTPTANFFGAARFDYTVSDGAGGTDTGRVNVTVTSVNDAPVAVDDTRSTAQNTALTVTSAALVSNDTDAESNTLTVTAVSNAVNGVVTLVSGTVTFTPTTNFTGAASFDYTVSDGNGGTDVGRVNINVTSPGGGGSGGGGGGGGSFGAGLALLALGWARRAWRARAI